MPLQALGLKSRAAMVALPFNKTGDGFHVQLAPVHRRRGDWRHIAPVQTFTACAAQPEAVNTFTRPVAAAGAASK